jgi:hypothetical protein
MVVVMAVSGVIRVLLEDVEIRDWKKPALSILPPETVNWNLKN